MLVFDDFAFRLERPWKRPREHKNLRFGAKEGPRERIIFWFGANEVPGTPSQKLNSDFGAKTRRRPSQNGPIWRNARGQWG